MDDIECVYTFFANAVGYKKENIKGRNKKARNWFSSELIVQKMMLLFISHQAKLYHEG